MVSHRRLILSGLVFVSSTFACGGPRPDNENGATRHGEDVLASGGEPTVTDSVPGDAILAGGEVRFSGVTGGDYLGAGGRQTIGGRIHGSLRAAGGEIHVAAAVDRNTTIAGGEIVLDSAAVITRNAYLVGGKIQVKGTVHEGLQASGGSVILNGVVGRDVQVAARALRVGPRAQIAGNLRYRVKAENVHIDPAARISGTVTALPVKGWGVRGVLWMFGLGFLVAGAVAVALFPRFATETAQTLRERPGRSALVACGWIILVPVAIILAAITIIGIPLALVAAAVYVIVLYLGRVPLALWIGNRVLGGRARAGRQGVLVSFLVGGFILLVVGLIPVVGPLAMLIATILGLGALLLQVQSSREKQPV